MITTQLLAITLWLIFGLFIAGTIIWAIFYIIGLTHDEGRRVWGADDVQVRIVTRGDAPQIARRTANRATQYFDDVHIISDTQIAPAPNTTVHTVPEDFVAKAKHKGRALVWAANNIDCDKEYVLYLDEDTIVTGFDGLPDNDIVQFLEKPMRSDSLLTSLIEAGRVGFQQEMRGFTKVAYPMYLWGGAFAVRKRVEEDIGWNEPSVAEDTTFLWRAINAGYEYGVTRQRYKNQAPPTIRALIEQRRRWFSGTVDALRFLPTQWSALVISRNLSAAASIATFYVIGVGTLVITIPLLVSIVLATGLLLWSLIGASRYQKGVRIFVLSILLFPILHTINAVGVVYGMVRPTDDFSVTEKR